MPLSKTGEKVKQEVKRRYGEKKGEQVFYAMENSRPAWTKKRK